MAELLAKELKNSTFIKETLNKDREGALHKTLYEILKNVSSKGKKNASKKNKKTVETSDGATKTQHLNNLSDNETLLSQVQVWQFMENVELDEESVAVKTLGKLDLALLLNILTNDVLNIPWLDIIGHLNIIKDIRNSIFHKDNDSITDEKSLIWEAVEAVHKYLGKDIDKFHIKKKMYFSSPLSTCCPLMSKFVFVCLFVCAIQQFLNIDQ